MSTSQSLPSTGNNYPEILTRKQAAEILQCDLSTLWKNTKMGKIKSYGLSSRVYYKYSEIIASLTPLN